MFQKLIILHQENVLPLDLTTGKHANFQMNKYSKKLLSIELMFRKHCTEYVHLFPISYCFREDDTLPHLKCI